MLMPTPATWMVRGATFALWALAAGSAVFWALRLGGGSGPVAAPGAPARQVGPVDPVAVARLLGSSPAAAAPTAQASLASRFQLLGVAAGARSGGGAAVIAVDGKPARAFRVGNPVDGELVLQSVQGRQAVLASQQTGQRVLTLEVPAVRKAEVGRAAGAGAAPAGVAAAPATTAGAVSPRSALAQPQPAEE